MDKTVTEAKGNFEGFIQNRMTEIANAAIAQNLTAINSGSDARFAVKGLPEAEKPSVLDTLRADREDPISCDTNSEKAKKTVYDER